MPTFCLGGMFASFWLKSNQKLANILLYAKYNPPTSPDRRVRVLLHFSYLNHLLSYLVSHIWGGSLRGGTVVPPPDRAKFRFKLLCHTYLLTLPTYLLYLLILLMGFIPYARLHTQMRIWSCLELSRAIWRYLELSKTILSYLKLAGAIYQEQLGEPVHRPTHRHRYTHAHKHKQTHRHRNTHTHTHHTHTHTYPTSRTRS